MIENRKTDFLYVSRSFFLVCDFMIALCSTHSPTFTDTQDSEHRLVFVVFEIILVAAQDAIP
jgi:hypothetical protein